jgi:hypothetical protein
MTTLLVLVRSEGSSVHQSLFRFFISYLRPPACTPERAPSHSSASQCVRLYVRGLLPLSLLLNCRMLNYEMIYVKELFMHAEFFWSCASKFSIYPFWMLMVSTRNHHSAFLPLLLSRHTFMYASKGLKMWLADTYLRTTKSSEMLY